MFNLNNVGVTLDDLQKEEYEIFKAKIALIEKEKILIKMIEDIKIEKKLIESREEILIKAKEQINIINLY